MGGGDPKRGAPPDLVGSPPHPKGPYPWFEGDDLEHHLHSEEPGEHHVQKVHHVVEGLGLLVVLGERGINCSPPSPMPLIPPPPHPDLLLPPGTP